LYSNTTGYVNLAAGYNALSSNTIGYNNVAIGGNALFANTSGSFNTATGTGALFTNTTGASNTALGEDALRLNSIGNLNSAIGRGALYNSTGGGNTAVGFDAIRNLTTGGNNIGIGWNAQVPNPAGNDQVRIGNTNITYAGIQVPWTITSDSRFKSNIQTSTLGLDFINLLRPVSYYRINDESKKTEYGFIAQELKAALHIAGVRHEGIVSSDDGGMLSVRYNDLIAPMVKATQELNEKVERLTQQNEQQLLMINQLLQRLDLLEKKK
jgi:hypothetical protein